jgi:hypothetical protein
VLTEKGFEVLLDVLAVIAENGLIAAPEEKLEDVVVPNMFAFAETDCAGLLNGIDVEELEFKPEGAPNTLD